MKRLSLLKFSRYFFVLFLLITVVPLFGLLFWNSYHLERLNGERHKQILELISHNIDEEIQRNLLQSVWESRRIAHSLEGASLRLADYKILLHAETAWWLDSPEAKAFLASHGDSGMLDHWEEQRDSHPQVLGDYCMNHHKLEIFYLVPLRNAHRGLLMVREVRLESLIPDGPHSAEFYTGSDLSESSRFGTVSPLPPHLRFKDPDGNPGPHGKFGHHPCFKGDAPHRDASNKMIPSLKPVSDNAQNLPPAQRAAKEAFSPRSSAPPFDRQSVKQGPPLHRQTDVPLSPHDGARPPFPPDGDREFSHDGPPPFPLDDDREFSHDGPPPFPPGGDHDFPHDGPPPFPPGGDRDFSHDGPPPCMHPHEDGPMFPTAPGFLGPHGELPPLSKEAKLILIKNWDGETVSTIRLRMRQMRPPGEENRQLMGALILLTGLFSSLWAGYYIHKNFIDPLARLLVLTQKVQSGDLSSRVETVDIRQTEVLQTLQNVNAMLDQLDEKERLRSNFISNLTHDFRTPLIAQTRSLELLIKDFDDLGMSQQAKLGRSLVNNNQHLLGMVNQLLETYQFEGGNLRLELESVALEPLVDACFEQLLPLAETRQITLEKEFPAEFPTIIGDAHCLNRVFINLIANGIENIPKGSRIRVIGQHRDDHVEIHVRDNGQGVSAEEQANLFDRYYAGMGDTRKLGSGLGLYICKMFVEAHQGQIQIDSVPGEYTDFTVRLPLQPGDSGKNESAV